MTKIYFYPPMEMLSILNGMNMAKINEDLMAAAILFHTVEDTDATMRYYHGREQ